MYVVINHLHLSVPVDRIREAAEQDLAAVFDALPGFEGVYLVKHDEHRATVLIFWDTAEHAANGGQVIGPGWFNDHVAPVLASEQQRSVGEVVYQHRPSS
jgi:hypothetical protein